MEEEELNSPDKGKGLSWPRLRLRAPFQFDKSAYLLILMLISVNFFHFTPISSFTGNDICLILFLLWVVASHFLYNPPERYLGFTLKKYYWPLLLIWAGVLISFLPAYRLYGQSFFWSFLTSRVMLAFLALPAIGTVNPGRGDLKKATTVFSIILLVFACLDALGIPVVDRNFFIREDRPDIELIDSDSFVMLLPGFQYVAVALFFYLDRLKTEFSSHNLIWSLFLIGVVFLIQNRTMLFISAVLFAYTFITIQGKTCKQTLILRYLSVLLLIAMIASTVPHWIRLFNETAEQLGDRDYNRVLAYTYFLFQACPGPVYYLTGTGFISANTSSVMKDLMAAGIFNSDVGFVGFWNYYGLLPLIAIFVVIFKGFSKKAPVFVKYNAFYILVGGLTIACFDTMDKILWFCMFVFMVYCHKGSGRPVNPSSTVRPS